MCCYIGGRLNDSPYIVDLPDRRGRLRIGPGSVVGIGHAERNTKEYMERILDRLPGVALKAAIIKPVRADNLGLTQRLILAMEKARDEGTEILILTIGGLDPMGIQSVRTWIEDRIPDRIALVLVSEQLFPEIQASWRFTTTSRLPS